MDINHNEANDSATIEYAFCKAAYIGDIESVKLFLSQGVDVHALHDTALCWALKAGRTEVVKLLMDNGADYHGLPADTFACGHPDTVRVLSTYKC